MKNTIIQIKLLFTMLIKIYKINPDFILTFTIKPNIFGGYIGKILNFPTICNISGLGISHKNFLLRFIVKYLYRFSLSKSYRCFFQNESDYNYFLKNKIVKKHNTIILRGSGVDTTHFDISDEDVIKRNSNNQFNFILSARLLWSKGVKEYVQASALITKEYKNVNCWLAGFTNSDNKNSIKLSLIQKWHKNKDIVFKESVDDIRIFLKKVNCFVLPSYYPEGTSRSLLEAASMKLPIITTNTPGCKDVVIKNVTGYLCKPKNYMDLYLKMKKILDDPLDKRLAMGEAGRSMIKSKFSDNVVNDIYIKTINDFSEINNKI
jgi:glycosyltransferase involved in cell wall biosynthesis